MIYLTDFRNPLIDPLPISLFYDYAEKSTKFFLNEVVAISVDGKTYYIPERFCSDGASIPRAFWGICEPLNGQYIGAFLKHDYCYANGISTREIVDYEMLDDLKLCGMSFAKRQAIYRAVRLFGSKYYRGNNNED